MEWIRIYMQMYIMQPHDECCAVGEGFHFLLLISLSSAREMDRNEFENFRSATKEASMKPLAPTEQTRLSRTA